MSKGDLRHRIRRGGSSNDSGFMYNSGRSSNNDKTKRKAASSVMRMADSEKGYANQILNEIPENRRQEIYEYMSLFGYKPDRTIVQVHITGFFKKKDYSQRQLEQHKATVKKYGGTTFVVIGRTHDPLIMDIVTRPKQKNPYDRSPGYVGYLWKNKDSGSKAPHEILPLDFTPVHLPYPEDWKNKFSTKGFMIALHVPSSLAKNKNKLTRALYRIGKTRVDVKKEWKFLTDLKNINYVQDANDAKNNKEVDNIAGVPSTSDRITGGTRSLKNEGHDMSDPLQILKVRLAKGEITRNEYNELYDAISS